MKQKKLQKSRVGNQNLSHKLTEFNMFILVHPSFPQIMPCHIVPCHPCSGTKHRVLCTLPSIYQCSSSSIHNIMNLLSIVYMIDSHGHLIKHVVENYKRPFTTLLPSVDAAHTYDDDWRGLSSHVMNLE